MPTSSLSGNKYHITFLHSSILSTTKKKKKGNCWREDNVKVHNPSMVGHLNFIEDTCKIHIIVIHINFNLTSVPSYSLVKSKITTENMCYIAWPTSYCMGLCL